MLIIGYILFLFVGIILGIIGGGGSILSVPIMVYVLGIDPALSTGYSLFIVGITALVGGISYFMKRQVDLRAALIFAIPGFLMVFTVRHFVMPLLPEHLFEVAGVRVEKGAFLMVIFAILMLSSAYSMIRIRIHEGVSSRKGLGWLIVVSLLIGTISGFLGAGGGFLIIPALVFMGGLEMKKAVGTSLLVIAINSLLGFTGNINKIVIDWHFLMLTSAICIVGILVGSTISVKISSQKLKPAFGWFTLIVGIFVLVKELILTPR